MPAEVVHAFAEHCDLTFGFGAVQGRPVLPVAFCHCQLQFRFWAGPAPGLMPQPRHSTSGSRVAFRPLFIPFRKFIVWFGFCPDAKPFFVHPSFHRPPWPSRFLWGRPGVQAAMRQALQSFLDALADGCLPSEAPGPGTGEVSSCYTETHRNSVVHLPDQLISIYKLNQFVDRATCLALTEH